MTNLSSGNPYTVRNEAWNGSLGAGATTTFGFLASWNNSTNGPATTTCSRTP